MLSTAAGGRAAGASIMGAAEVGGATGGGQEAQARGSGPHTRHCHLQQGTAAALRAHPHAARGRAVGAAGPASAPPQHSGCWPQTPPASTWRPPPASGSAPAPCSRAAAPWGSAAHCRSRSLQQQQGGRRRSVGRRQRATRPAGCSCRRVHPDGCQLGKRPRRACPAQAGQWALTAHPTCEEFGLFGTGGQHLRVLAEVAAGAQEAQGRWVPHSGVEPADGRRMVPRMALPSLTGRGWWWHTSGSQR